MVQVNCLMCIMLKQEENDEYELGTQMVIFKSLYSCTRVANVGKLIVIVSYVDLSGLSIVSLYRIY